MKLFRVLPATVAAAALVLAGGCSPGGNSSSSSQPSDAPSASGEQVGENPVGPYEGGKAELTFRLWDESVAPAYEESFATFHNAYPDITVKVEVVGWEQYWKALPLDMSSGQMADLFWTNSSSFGRYADNGDLVNVTDVFGDQEPAWLASTADLYQRDGKLWGVPQLWDSIALYYNKELTKAAGVDSSDLTWAPGAGEGDTLLPALKKLTVDKAGKHPGDDGFNPESISQFGMNAAADLQAIYLDFLAESGSTFQADDDAFAFADEAGQQAFSYLVDLINTHHVAPSAADTNVDGEYALNLFLQGKMGLFQSGPYHLSAIADQAKFEWGLAPMIAGPEGRVSVVHSVAVLGNANSKHAEATALALKWLGSADGQRPIAKLGTAFPAVQAVQQEYVDFWADKNVDVTPFIEAAAGTTQKAPVGPKVGAGMDAYTPIIKEIFLGLRPVEQGLKDAQDAGNKEME